MRPRLVTRLAPFVTAVAFLTRVPVPVPARRGGDGEDVARSLAWFPFVGALIGVVVGGVHAVVAELVTPLVGAAMAVTVGALVTGGFHEDGLGDTADGFGGGWTPEQRLEIMGDSRQGTYGVLAICCSVVVRVAALSALTGFTAVLAVAAVHLLARMWAVAALLTTGPARPGGLGTAARGAGTAGRHGIGPGLALVLGGWSLLALAALGPPVFAATAAAGAVGAAAVTLLARRKIGGLTGDVAGAVEQVAEGLGLVAVVGSVAGRGLW